MFEKQSTKCRFCIEWRSNNIHCIWIAINSWIWVLCYNIYTGWRVHIHIHSLAQRVDCSVDDIFGRRQQQQQKMNVYATRSEYIKTRTFQAACLFRYISKYKLHLLPHRKWKYSCVLWVFRLICIKNKGSIEIWTGDKRNWVPLHIHKHTKAIEKREEKGRKRRTKNQTIANKIE